MRNGFTLIEILVTVALIGILATASLIVINPATQLKKSRDSKRKADLAQLQSAFELYRSDQGAYPTSPLPACGSSLTVSGTTYIKSIPCDPKNSGQYVYTYLPVGNPVVSYTIVSCIENVSDSDKDPTNNPAYCTGGNTNWSHTVSNP